MDNFSRKRSTVRNKQMEVLKVKSTVTEVKDAFNWPIIGLNTTEK